jgi:hypothetical protein
MRRDVDSYAFAGRLDALADQVLARRQVATEEDVVGGLHAAHGQLATGQIEVHEQQILDFTQPQTTLPEQVESSPVEQGVAPLVRRRVWWLLIPSVTVTCANPGGRIIRLLQPDHNADEVTAEVVALIKRR